MRQRVESITCFFAIDNSGICMDLYTWIAKDEGHTDLIRLFRKNRGHRRLFGRMTCKIS